MYAHVTTYRLATSAEVTADVAHADETGEPISDQTARTLASWWQSPASRCRNIAALSHGMPFDTDELADEIGREISDPTDADALFAWLDSLTELLAEFANCDECAEPIDYCQGHGLIA
jgi:hypothetical protein